MKQVVIEVLGGVAHIAQVDEGVEVEIVDLDNHYEECEDCMSNGNCKVVNGRCTCCRAFMEGD